MTTQRFTAPDDADLDAFYCDVADADLQPLWRQHELMVPTPPIHDVPHLWPGKVLRALAERSGELVPVDRGGDRRVLSLCNPGLGGLPYATTTLWGAVQYLGPGEVAPAHRHTAAALRFVLEGSGVWTLVDRDPVAMAPGDLVLTPSLRWHEHHNPRNQPMMWFDGLDIPLVRSVDALFFEPGPDREIRRDVDPVSASERTWGLGAGLLPAGAAPAARHSPLFAYRRTDTDRALTILAAREDSGHAAVRFTDPATARDVMPTMRCESTGSCLAGGLRRPGGSARPSGSSTRARSRRSWLAIASMPPPATSSWSRRGRRSTSRPTSPPTSSPSRTSRSSPPSVSTGRRY